MDWVCYRLTYRLLSPMRVGLSQAGNLQTTRPYAPGRLLWAALTARLARRQGGAYAEAIYQQFGALLQANLRFGYLWPSLDGVTPRYPWEAPEDFEYDFLGSFVSTALDYTAQAALPGSLHEAEFIAPRTRRGQPVFLTGLLWVNRQIEPPGWQSALRQVALGGERRYGWGRLALESGWQPLAAPEIPQPDDFSWTARIPAHLRAPQAGGFQAAIEPLVGWETHGQRKSLTREVQAAYLPGAQPAAGQRFRIAAQDGVWELLA